MTPDLEALVVAAYVFADEYPVPARPGPAARIADAELVALAVCQAAMGISSDRQFLGLVGYRLPGWFPHLPSQSQYNRRLRGLTGLLTVVQQRLARLLDAGGAAARRRDVDRGRQLRRLRARSEFAGTAAYGYCAAKSEWVWGVRLVAARRPARAAARLHLGARQRARIRAAARPGRGRRDSDRRQGPVGPRLQRADGAAPRCDCSHPARERTAANHARERALASPG